MLRETHKMYAVVAKEALDDMNGNRGKLCAQTGHAFLHAFWDASVRFPEDAAAYQKSGLAVKVTLIVPTIADLGKLLAAYRDKCGVSLVTDAARTVFNVPTTTCLGIGPIAIDDIDIDLRSIPVLI